ncbi:MULTISPECIES: response regulator transcription factor [Metallibacterium]|jgi:DNA-binding response OmpR family regulator|uniref:response regulator transcription factor n=1 Tax=Metallibacterium TaxID=1218803 RepID=UPI00260BBF9D|nr:MULTISPECIES: response regulator transcription factor [Metallibacterium]
MNKHRWVVGVLEDDPEQSGLVQIWLEKAGYEALLFSSAAEFRRGLGHEAIDLLLLDWMLPDASGLEVLEWIRSAGNPNLPVVFLTARAAESDIVRGLEVGADDYVVKPPKQGELLARVAAVLRRRGGEVDADALLEVPPYAIDFTKRRVRIGSDDFDLTQREFDLASYLFRRHGRIVSREALLEQVWNLSPGLTTRTVDTHISRLRKKLALSGEHGWKLTAVYQHGYRLEQV